MASRAWFGISAIIISGAGFAACGGDDAGKKFTCTMKGTKTDAVTGEQVSGGGTAFSDRSFESLEDAKKECEAIWANHAQPVFGDCTCTESSSGSSSTSAAACRETEAEKCVTETTSCATKCTSAQDPFQCPCQCWASFKTCATNAGCKTDDLVRKGLITEPPGCTCSADSDCSAAVKKYDPTGTLSAACAENKMCKLSGPAAPNNVRATPGNKMVTLEWDPILQATSYNIYWAQNSAVKKDSGTKITNGTSPYKHEGLENGKTYYYVVTSVGPTGEGVESAEVSATPKLTKVPAPTGVSAKVESGAITLSWNPVPDVTSYSVYYDTETVQGVAAEVPRLKSIKNITITSVKVENLDSGTTYYFLVTATIGSDESLLGEIPEIKATTLPLPATTLATLEADRRGSYNSLVVVPSYVYWIETGKIRRASFGGGEFTITISPETIASVSGTTPCAIAVDNSGVYWTEFQAVKKVSLDGGFTKTILASGVNPTEGSWCGGLVVDSASAYWTESGAVKKVGLAGGTVTTLASGLDRAQGIAVDATNVYWTERTSVKKVPIGGGTVTTLASGLRDGEKIALDSANVYWTESSTELLRTVPIGGGTVTTLAFGVSTGGWGLAVDSTNVYWTESTAVKAVPVTGGTPRTLATGLDAAGDIDVDATSVYWTERRAVKKVSKK